MARPKLLELFAGSRSIGKVAGRRGWEVFSVDLKPFPRIDLAADINEIHVRQFPFVPDMIWASPPCTTFSVMSLRYHWTVDHLPKSDAAVLGVRMVLKTLRIIRYFNRCNPKLVYYIENPRGKLRKLPIVSLMPRATVSYCKYGDKRMKPTDIWTNNLAGNGGSGHWRPRPMCFPGNPDCRHEKCPYTNRCGTQGLANAYERSKVPAALARDVLDAVYRPKT